MLHATISYLDSPCDDLPIHQIVAQVCSQGGDASSKLANTSQYLVRMTWDCRGLAAPRQTCGENQSDGACHPGR